MYSFYNTIWTSIDLLIINREEWIKSIQNVSNDLSGNVIVDKSKKDHEKIVNFFNFNSINTWN